MSDDPRKQLSDALRWALDTSVDAATASADWLAMDIDRDCDSAEQLLTKPDVRLSTLCKAKSAYKTMRIVGETSADRRIGARLYAASIAVALTRFGVRISRQSDGALSRAFRSLLDDRTMPAAIRDAAGHALSQLLSEPDLANALVQRRPSRSRGA
jgi:hypothetical protein